VKDVQLIHMEPVRWNVDDVKEGEYMVLIDSSIFCEFKSLEYKKYVCWPNTQ
jgi:hypothetical protein